MALDIRPLAAPLGALVSGWNPQAELGSQEHADILRGLRQYQVLVFRGHERPSDVELVRFARSFGDLVKGSEWFGDIGKYTEILPVNNLFDDDRRAHGHGRLGVPGMAHRLLVCLDGRQGELLEAELPAQRPRPVFASSRPGDPAAQDRGHAAAATRLSQLDYLYPAGQARDRRIPQRAARGFPGQKGAPTSSAFHSEAEHPVTPPGFGPRDSYVNPGITRHIVGLPRDESDALLKEPTPTRRAPPRCMPTTGGSDLVVFDTLGTLSARRLGPDPAARHAPLSTLWNPSTAA